MENNDETPESLSLLILANLAFDPENHKYIYKTNIVELLFQYIKNPLFFNKKGTKIFS